MLRAARPTSSTASALRRPSSSGSAIAAWRGRSSSRRNRRLAPPASDRSPLSGPFPTPEPTTRPLNGGHPPRGQVRTRRNLWLRSPRRAIRPAARPWAGPCEGERPAPGDRRRCAAETAIGARGRCRREGRQRCTRRRRRLPMRRAFEGRGSRRRAGARRPRRPGRDARPDFPAIRTIASIPRPIRRHGQARRAARRERRDGSRRGRSPAPIARQPGPSSGRRSGPRGAGKTSRPRPPRRPIATRAACACVRRRRTAPGRRYATGRPAQCRERAFRSRRATRRRARPRWRQPAARRTKRRDCPPPHDSAKSTRSGRRLPRPAKAVTTRHP